MKLASVEVELSDVSLGTSHPKFISRQEEILAQQRTTLDEVKEYLESSENDDSHLKMVANTKWKTLEDIYSAKRADLDAVQEEWKQFDQNVIDLLAKLKQLETESSPEKLEEVRNELEAYKAKIKEVSSHFIFLLEDI